jgi:hypothetical protein
MNENHVITVPIKDAAGMGALGATLWENLFNPFLCPVYPEQSLVVLVYGVHKSGKSPLLDAARAACLSDASAPFSFPDKVADALFKTNDFGNETYPGPAQMYFPATGMSVNLETPDLSRSYDMPILDKRANPEWVYFLEHAPLDPLQKADIGIIISWPGQNDRNLSYLEAMSSGIEACAEKLGVKEPTISNVVRRMREAQKDVCNDPNERIVRIFLPTENPHIEKAFLSTRKIIQQKFALHS